MEPKLVCIQPHSSDVSRNIEQEGGENRQCRCLRLNEPSPPAAGSGLLRCQGCFRRIVKRPDHAIGLASVDVTLRSKRPYDPCSNRSWHRRCGSDSPFHTRGSGPSKRASCRLANDGNRFSHYCVFFSELPFSRLDMLRQPRQAAGR